MSRAPTPDEVRSGARGALARALNVLEGTRDADRKAAEALVDALVWTPREGSHVVGLTGPPGVGKSTLAGKLTAAWRAKGLTVGVVAVDPTSRRSGGALLGDRARMGSSGRDAGLFIRSMAARDRLGGLAPATAEAVWILRAACDRVLVETVGVGQSETDVSGVADTTVVVVQPASGDTLQFIKAGIMEIPDVLVVNKADLGAAARRTRSDLKAALGVLGEAETPIVETSATTGDGVDALVEALEARSSAIRGNLPQLRRSKVRTWLVGRFRELYGTLALQRLGGEAGAIAALEARPDGAPLSESLEALRSAAG